MLDWVWLPSVYPEVSDMVYGLHRLRDGIENLRKGIPHHNPMRRLEGDKSILKEKTLLLRSDWMDDTFDTITIDSLYPYDYRIVDNVEFNHLILGGDSDYAYVMIIPFVGNLLLQELNPVREETSVDYSHYLVDANGGRLIDIILEPYRKIRKRKKKSFFSGTS